MDIRAKITISSNFGSTVIDTSAPPPPPNPLTDWLLKLIQPKVVLQGNASIPNIVSQDFYVPYTPYGEPTHNYTPIVIGFVVLIVIGLVLWAKSK